MCYSMRGHLTEVSNTGELVPDLSEGFEASDDAATWRVKLRPGVEFHNGKTMTVDDVIASINHHRTEDTKSAVKAILKPVKDIRADGDAVVFELEAGNADFPFILADYHLAILPSKDGVVDWQSGQGTGAFMLADYEPGVRASLKANPNFYKEGKGHFDGLELLTIADVAARTNALTTGRSRRDRPRGPEDGAFAQAQQGGASRRDQRHATLHLRHALRHRALYQQRRAPGLEVRD